MVVHSVSWEMYSLVPRPSCPCPPPPKKKFFFGGGGGGGGGKGSRDVLLLLWVRGSHWRCTVVAQRMRHKMLTQRTLLH